jgi:hypothetical protein
LKVISIIKSLLPDGTDGRSLKRGIPTKNNVDLCPIWPPDIFAITGTLIERSGCYTEAGPSRDNVKDHGDYLEKISKIVDDWTTDAGYLFVVPSEVQALWTRLVRRYADVEAAEIIRHPALVKDLLLLFSLSDEASKGMGWDTQRTKNIFADLALVSLVTKRARVPTYVPRLKHFPYSLCALVPPTQAIVMPKTLTATVGCTIRSLSHHLALLPHMSQCCPSWALSMEEESLDAYKPTRLLVVPFPFTIPDDSFTLAQEPVRLWKETYSAAYFGLQPKWLTGKGRAVTALRLFRGLIEPLIKAARATDSTEVTGLIMPECALTDDLADELAELVRKTGLSFFTTGVIAPAKGGVRARNVAKTYILHKNASTVALEQFKHHRWRLDDDQCAQYGLHFHRRSRSDKWWEDIEVSNRQLPFFALRRDMSMTVLICEDLARNDPAMSIVRAVGPNLVIALLMDGPQRKTRWSNKYATVLGEDPGSGVLSVSCAAMVDRSNANWKKDDQKRVIGLWRSEDNSGQEIELPAGCQGVVLDIHSRPSQQHTLDARTDNFATRKLSLGKWEALKLAHVPAWL